MTEKANPSINRPAEAYKTAGAIAYGGHGADGFVVDGASPTEISVQDGGIAEADLNAFAETSGGASLDVTIDGGEAFVFGSWLAIDTDTTVSLAASTTNQTVYVGWNKNGGDDVIVGLAGAFSSASGDTDERIPLWTFDTDGTGVTSVTDERAIGYTQEATTFTGSVSLGDNALNDTSNIAGTNGSSIDFQFGGSNDTALETQGSDIVLYDSANSVRLLSAQEGGTIDLRANIDFLDSDSIRDNGTDAIQFDGSQNVTIANGNLSLGSNEINNASGITITDGTADWYASVKSGNYELTKFGTSNIEMAIYAGDRIQFENLDINAGDGNLENVNNIIKNDTRNGMEIIDPTGGSLITIFSDDSPFGRLLDFGEMNRMTLPKASSDPSAAAGEMWYRDDLD